MITRRALLTLGAVSLATPLSACSVDSLDRLRPAKPTPKVDPDAVLVGQVRAALEQARALAAGTPFAPLHDTQLAALDGPSPSPSANGSATTPPATTAQVRTSEAALQQHLLAACRDARSGRLATVFASMAAGIGQALA